MRAKICFSVLASALLLHVDTCAAATATATKAAVSRPASKTGGALPPGKSSSGGSRSTHHFSPLEARCMLVTASCMYGSNYITTKLLQDRIEPAMVTMLRFLIASMFFGPPIVSYLAEERERIAREGSPTPLMKAANKGRTMTRTMTSSPQNYDLLLGSAWLGLFCAVGFVSQSVALVHTSASKCAFSCGLGVLMPPVFDAAERSWKRLRRVERYDAGKRHFLKSEFIPPALALLGAAILEYNGLGEPARLSDLLLLITPLSFSLCFWLSEKHSRKFPDHTEAITGVMLSTVTVMTLSWTLVTSAFPTSMHSLSKFARVLLEPRVAAALLFTGVATTAWTSYIEQRALQVLSSAEITLTYSLEPIFAAVFAAAFLDETFTPSVAAGAAFIIFGCMWSSIVEAILPGGDKEQ